MMETAVREKIELSIAQKTLEEHATSIGVKLDKSENFWITAVQEAQDVLTMHFAGDRDKFCFWWGQHIGEGDVKPHRSWKRMASCLSFIDKRLEKGKSVEQAIDLLDRKIKNQAAADARYNEKHPERRGKWQTSYGRYSSEANEASSLESIKTRVRNFSLDELDAFINWFDAWRHGEVT